MCARARAIYESYEMPEAGETRERILNLPPAVSALLIAFVAIHAAMTFGPDWLGQFLYDRLAFVPAKLAFLFEPNAVLAHLATLDKLSPDDENRLARTLNAGRAYLSPVGYAFLHGDWTHLSVNGLSLAAFGSPVARRLGTRVFLFFMAACALFGAMTHFALHPYELTPVVGASAAISGTMGALARFAFAPGAMLSARPSQTEGLPDMDAPKIAPMSELLANPRAVVFVVVWLVLNVVLGAFPQAVGIESVIAWEAHAGGFLFGLLIFGFFDPVTRSRRAYTALGAAKRRKE